MRKLCLFFLAVLFAHGANAGIPSPTVIRSCLTNQSVGETVRYTDLSADELTEEDDEGRDRVVKTVQLGRERVGLWEMKHSREFGLVFGRRFVRLREVVKLGKHSPEPLELQLAIYGQAISGNDRYVCVTFNFDGLGRSGTFQNVRGLYLIETTRRPVRFYYTVGDIRHSTQ